MLAPTISSSNFAWIEELKFVYVENSGSVGGVEGGEIGLTARLSVLDLSSTSSLSVHSWGENISGPRLSKSNSICPRSGKEGNSSLMSSDSARGDAKGRH